MGLPHCKRHQRGQRSQAPADGIQNASRNEMHEGHLPLQQKQSSVFSVKFNNWIWIVIFLRNRKNVPCFYGVIETRVEVWKNEKSCVSLANFYCQYADRHMDLKLRRRVSERERAIWQFVIVKNIDTKSHAFGLRLTLFDPISRNHAIQTKYHSFFLNTTTRGKFFNWDGDER